MASARCVECGADSGAGNVFCTACWLKRLRAIEKVGEPVRLGYGARRSEAMGEGNELDALERRLIEQIQDLQRDYERAAAPLVRRLAEVRALRPSPPLFVRGSSGESLPWVTAKERGDG